jgi:hypothetical protein
MPGGFDVMILDRMVEKGHVPSHYHEQASEIIDKLCTLIMLAAAGDEECEVLVTAIRKIVQPRRYEVPQNKIREIIRYGNKPSISAGVGTSPHHVSSYSSC